MTNNEILVINAGSSSIKFAAFDTNHQQLTKTLSGAVENIHTAPKINIKNCSGKANDPTANSQKEDTGESKTIYSKQYATPQTYAYFYDFIFEYLNSLGYNIVAVGHRVVHGGTNYKQPVLITKKITAELKTLIPYAPLHQPYNVEAIEIISEHFPAIPQVACFDTAFHATHPKIADLFAIPKAMSEEGIKRYGFHGLSYEYIESQLETLTPSKAKGRVIVAHLGNGASLCAIKDGKSIDSTMGFSTLDGLVMGTRPGNLDAGVLLYLMQFKKLDFESLQKLLYQQCGLLGISGVSNDMRMLEAVEKDNIDAKLAIDLFVYRIVREFGALMSVLKGCDLLVFTGGIGENSTTIREKVCKELAWCGVKCDEKRNRGAEAVISTPDSAIEVRVVPTNEEGIIAKHTARTM